MQTLITLNNIIIIALGSFLILRIVLWYFKKDSPLLKEEWSCTVISLLFFVVSFATLTSYMMHGEVAEHVLYLCGCAYSVGITIAVIHFLMEVREKLPDSRTKKK